MYIHTHVGRRKLNLLASAPSAFIPPGRANWSLDLGFQTSPQGPSQCWIGMRALLILKGALSVLTVTQPGLLCRTSLLCRTRLQPRPTVWQQVMWAEVGGGAAEPTLAQGASCPGGRDATRQREERGRVPSAGNWAGPLDTHYCTSSASESCRSE